MAYQIGVTPFDRRVLQSKKQLQNQSQDIYLMVLAPHFQRKKIYDYALQK
jgi:hypothetical protein